MDYSVSVVLPAAGSGSRMKSTQLKQFINLRGIPVVCHTIKAFEAIEWIRAVVITVPAQTDDETSTLFAYCGPKLQIACGGPTRHRSIWNGLKSLSNNPPNVVVIHDGVRPFIDEQTVRACAEAAHLHGASGMTRPLVSTVVAPDARGFLDHSLDRAKHCASEMPQAFHYDLICRAYEACSDYDLEHGTECLHLVHKYCGVKPRLLEGPDTLWKITYGRDLRLAEWLMKEQTEKQPKHVLVVGTDFREDIKACVLQAFHGADVVFIEQDGVIVGHWDVAVISGVNIDEMKKEKLPERVVLINWCLSDLPENFNQCSKLVMKDESLPLYVLLCQCQRVDDGSKRIASIAKFNKTLSDILKLESGVLVRQIFIA